MISYRFLRVRFHSFFFRVQMKEQTGDFEAGNGKRRKLSETEPQRTELEEK